MIDQLRSDRNARMTRTICVTKVAFITSSIGPEGTDPRDACNSNGTKVTIGDYGWWVGRFDFVAKR